MDVGGGHRLVAWRPIAHYDLPGHAHGDDEL